jgi:hypothetical protein
MKISKITWFILIIGVAVIGTVGLYLVYDDEIDQQDILRASIETAQSNLPSITTQRENLEAQIADLEIERDEIEADLELALTLFPDDVQSIFYGDLLFFFGRQFELRVVNFSATGPYTYSLNGINYIASTFTLDIETDDVDAIMAYLTTLELGDDFVTTKINAVSSNIVQQDPNTPEDELSTASISITILSHGGS